MLPFRLSELDWIALELAKRKKRIVWYFHVSPFVTKVCDKKYTYRLKIHFPRKKKKEKKKEKQHSKISRYREQVYFTHHKRNGKLGFILHKSIEFFEGCTHEAKTRYDQLIFHSSYTTSFASNESVDRTIPRRASFVQLVQLFRINHDSTTATTDTIFTVDTEPTWTRLRKLTARKC